MNGRLPGRPSNDDFSRSIVIVPFHAEGLDLEALRGPVASVFGSPVVITSHHIDYESACDPSRRQYDGMRLLALLESLPGLRVLGVTRLDLFIPIFTFVFGLARLRGRSAVISSFRLGDAEAGLAPDGELLHSRLAKEAVHELGHTTGLPHCPDALCVMASSSVAEDVDEKEAVFCRECAMKARMAA